MGSSMEWPEEFKFHFLGVCWSMIFFIPSVLSLLWRRKPSLPRLHPRMMRFSHFRSEPHALLLSSTHFAGRIEPGPNIFEARKLSRKEAQEGKGSDNDGRASQIPFGLGDFRRILKQISEKSPSSSNSEWFFPRVPNISTFLVLRRRQKPRSNSFALFVISYTTFLLTVEKSLL